MSTTSKTKYKLRPYQKQASDNIIKDLETYRSCGAVLPTGSGKTLIMIDVIDRIREKMGLSDMILIMCHLTDPLYQLYEEYNQKGARPARTTTWKKSIFSSSLSVDTLFASMQKMAINIDWWKKRNEQKMVRHPRYIIIDEAHAYGAESYRQIERLFPDAQIIGLSATPFRSNRYSFSQFERVSYTIPMSQLIDEGYLVEPRLTEINFGSDDSDASRIALCFKIWKERERSRGLPTIIYFPTTEMARNAVAALATKCRVAYMDGTTPYTETKRIFESAKVGDIDIILNCQKLETGVDIPMIGSIMMPYKCGSVARYVQRVGRGLRLFPGKEYCSVYLFGDTPSLERGDWSEIHNLALGIEDPLPSESLSESLDDLDPDREDHRALYYWTEIAIEACRKLENVDMITLADHLSKKRFPSKYEKHIQRIFEGAQTSSESTEPATKSQLFMLKDTYGYEERHLRNLTHKEASMLLNGLHSWVHREAWTIKRGPYIGHHPKNVPGLYKKHCRDPQVKGFLVQWYRAGRPRPKT